MKRATGPLTCSPGVAPRPDGMTSVIARVVLIAVVWLMNLGIAHAQIAFRSSSAASAQGPAFRAAAQAVNATAPNIAFVGAGAQVTGTGASITPAIPAFQSGDFAILIVGGRPPNNDTTVPAAPAGWTSRSSVANTGPNPDLRIMTFYKVLVAGDANPAVTLPASWRTTSNGMSAQIAVWRGVDSGTPFDVADATATSGAVQNWTAPAITTVTDNAWVASAVATSDDNTLSIVTAQGFAGRMSGAGYSTTTGGDHSIGLADVAKTPAGATTMLTWRQTANISDSWAGITFALRPAQALTVAVPAGTAQNDVMIASIAFRANQPGLSTDMAINAPAGWTLIRRMNETGATSNALAIYRRVAGPAEPASYQWTFACYSSCASSGFQSAIGGIVSFSGVDTTTPLDVENGQNTVAGAQTTPSVTTTIANAMLVTSHGYASAGTWTPAGGMTEKVDIQGAQLSLEMSYASQASAGATGAKQATPTPDDNAGNAHILALKPLAQGLTLTVPVGTALDDVMIAAIGFAPSSASLTAPAGWVLVRRTDNANGNTNSLAVYRRVASASEPASYTWSFAGVGDAAGGIQTFSGVDTSAPVDVENGQCTPSPCSLAQVSHSTPSVTTSVANTMLVTAHTFASSRTWTAPAGMTEGFDVTSQSASASGQSIEGSYVSQASAGATGAKTATASGDADVGNTHILALRPAPPPPPPVGGFNGYETATAAGATSGVIKTKVAGANVSLDIIALNAAKTAILTTFTGAVKVEVLDASNNTGPLDANGCRATWSVIQTLSNPTFASGDNGRKTISFTEPNSYRDVRLRISYPTSSPTTIGCSSDDFAIRPSSFATFGVSDSNRTTAGTSRALDDLTITAPGSGGRVHNAGRPFSVRATAVNASSVTTTNYAGAPTATLSACGSAACTATTGALTLDTTFSAGALASDVASYNDVGAFWLQLVDSTFASVDAADSTAAEREIRSARLDVGRFVPDHFAVALNTPVFGTACGRFTYVGQRFNYTTAPVITVTAQDAANNTTARYTGSLWRITNASLTNRAYTPTAATLDTTGAPNPDPAIDATNRTLTFSSGTGFFFIRSTPAAPFNAEVSLEINVIDDDAVAYAGNPAKFGAATPGNGIAFSDGNALTVSDKEVRFGRFRVNNANGSQLISMPLRMETQYWNGTAFVTNTDDTCTTIGIANLSLGNYQRNLNSGETTLTIDTPLTNGVGRLRLSAPGSANGGSVDVSINLSGVAAGASCTAGMAVSTGLNLTYLQGAWCGATYNRDPTARATFGVYRNTDRMIYIRENF